MPPRIAGRGAPRGPPQNRAWRWLHSAKSGGASTAHRSVDPRAGSKRGSPKRPRPSRLGHRPRSARRARCARRTLSARAPTRRPSGSCRTRDPRGRARTPNHPAGRVAPGVPKSANRIRAQQAHRRLSQPVSPSAPPRGARQARRRAILSRGLTWAVSIGPPFGPECSTDASLGCM
jgi:hypothetical protein